MSDKMRWRFGDTNPVQASVRPETIIEIGDLLWLDEWFAEPFQADRSFDGHSQFLGVAMQRSQKGEQTPIRVSTTGTFEFDCEPTICLLGDRIAIKEKQQICLNPDIVAFIGKSDRSYFTPTIRMLVRIRSQIMAL